MSARRVPAPEWAVWSLMTALWSAAGCPVAAEGMLVNMIGEV